MFVEGYGASLWLFLAGLAAITVLAVRAVRNRSGLPDPQRVNILTAGVMLVAGLAWSVLSADKDGNASINLPPPPIGSNAWQPRPAGPHLGHGCTHRGTGVNPSPRSANDELVNLALIGLAAAFVLALVLRAAGMVASFVTGQRPPTVGVVSGLRVVADPAHPGRALGVLGLSRVTYWSSF